MKLLCLLLFYLIISGIITLLMGWRVFHRENIEPQLNNISKEITGHLKNGSVFTRDDSLVLLYLICVFFGFIILSLSVRKLLKRKK